MKFDDRNHWSKRPWIASQELDSTTLYTDLEQQLFTIDSRVPDHQQLAGRIASLHNGTLTPRDYIKPQPEQLAALQDLTQEISEERQRQREEAHDEKAARREQE